MRMFFILKQTFISIASFLAVFLLFGAFVPDAPNLYPDTQILLIRSIFLWTYVGLIVCITGRKNILRSLRGVCLPVLRGCDENR